ncbi:MAG: phytanoyl-CoA dioxygenase family protein [Candidatus Latescibacteria bacterium]|nr:phytanoyl-CoA dioxygenase family protein [Candidatus Latescibacterota bacterium]
MKFRTEIITQALEALRVSGASQSLCADALKSTGNATTPGHVLVWEDIIGGQRLLELAMSIASAQDGVPMTKPVPEGTMTEAEIYEFDLNGYIIYRNILSGEEVHRMNVIIDEHQARNIPNIPFFESHDFSFFELDPCFIELMANPRTLRIIRVLVGNWLRLDHAYGLQMTKETETPETLRGGPRGDHGEHQYQWVEGRMYNGLTTVMYVLEDLHSGDGGFVCVPGSHKANLYYRPPIDSHMVVNPSLKAGDMVIYTEALVHGARRWQVDHRWRALLYKYSPGNSGWLDFESIKHYRDLATNDLQRDILRPPNVRARLGLRFPAAEGE